MHKQTDLSRLIQLCVLCGHREPVSAPRQRVRSSQSKLLHSLHWREIVKASNFIVLLNTEQLTCTVALNINSLFVYWALMTAVKHAGEWAACCFRFSFIGAVKEKLVWSNTFVLISFSVMNGRRVISLDQGTLYGQIWLFCKSGHCTSRFSPLTQRIVNKPWRWKFYHKKILGGLRRWANENGCVENKVYASHCHYNIPSRTQIKK